MEATADEDGVVLPVHRVGGWPRSGFSDLGNLNPNVPGTGYPTLAAFLFLRLRGPQRQVFVVGVNEGGKP
jgi:hypothetical protein